MLINSLRLLNQGNVIKLKKLSGASTNLLLSRRKSSVIGPAIFDRSEFQRKCFSILNIYENSYHLKSKLFLKRSLSNHVSFLCQKKVHATQETLTSSGNLEDKKEGIMKVLNVAEKNDAAKRIANLLGNGQVQTNNGFSVYNKLYKFQYTFRGQRCDMTMTSVSGHLLNLEFDNRFRKWYSCDPVELFDAPVEKQCSENMKDIKKTLECQAAYHQVLIIWTDCDREGENIGYEVISVCQRLNPRLQIFRAKFSEITKQSVENAMSTLGQPDKRVSDAVDVRQELDLRIGAAFTRFQTLRLQRKFAHALADHLISYGSCQFPTLGFVVERYKAVQEFVPEQFWKIDVTHEKDGLNITFSWARNRLFEYLAVQTLYEACIDNPTAHVVNVESKPKSKWRPVALDTIEFEKLASRKLKIGAKEAMQIAEHLYTAGYISYPRTETNIFPPSLNLTQLVEDQQQSGHWGGFATRVLNQPNGPDPRNGKKSDQAHPPIHPTKFHDMQGLDAKQRKVYELIVRHFLACCSKDAKGQETKVEIEIAEERFIASGLIIKERNYLDVYIYDKWSDKELPDFDLGESFVPKTIALVDGKTSPPNLLTEADLIALMEKHGIGTDATHAEHIETIKTRQYVGLNGIYFIPGLLGMGLVEGYDAMGFEMSKPHLRAELEADLQKICEGRRRPADVLAEQVRKYKEVFVQASDQVVRLDEAMAKRLNNPGGGVGAGNNAPGPGNGGGGGPRGGGGGGPGNGPGGGPRGGGPGNAGRGAPRGGGRRNDGNRRGGVAGADGPARRGGNRRRNDDDDEDYGGFGGGHEVRAPIPQASRQPPTVPQARIQPQIQNENTMDVGGVTCHCGLPPDIRITRKEGPNCGRQFYKCDACGFFDWVDKNNDNQRAFGNQSVSNTASRSMPPPSMRPPPSTQMSSGNSHQPRSQSTFSTSHDSNEDSAVPNCHCGKPAESYTVKKEGVNKGRLFYGCSTRYGEPGRCNFFDWNKNAPADDQQSFVPSTSPFQSNRRGRGGGQISSSRGRGRGAPPPSGVKRRKCGLCHQEGHTRKKCPLAYEEDNDEDMDTTY